MTPSGSPEIVDGNLQLCLNQPENKIVRIILVETLRRLKKVRPQVVEEYRDKVILLQKEHPLTAPAHGILERMVTEVYP